MPMINHIHFVDKRSGNKMTPKQMVEADPERKFYGFNFICSTICNYGVALDDDDSLWKKQIEGFFNDGNEGDDVFCQTVFETLTYLRERYTVELYQPKRLLIEILTEDLDTVEDFDAVMAQLRRLYFTDGDNYVFGTKRPILQNHDDFEQAGYASHWEN